MADKKRKKASIGDIFELTTPAGLAYFQYTAQHPMFGGLIRVLPGTYDVRPANISDLVRGRERYFIFFPVRAAAYRGLIAGVGLHEIPPHARSFPLFKAGRPPNWWLWDGQREWRVGELAPDQRALPTRGIWNLAMLAARIARGWTPEDDAIEST